MKIGYGYLRISNEDQSNFSISGQKIIIEDWCRKNNVEIQEWFIDEGFSAKNFNRPEWKRLESKLAKSKIDFLVVAKYDRLIRNVVEGLAFVERLEKKWNVTLLSVMENYSIDINDPYFFKHRADMFVDADFERRRISHRTKFGIWSASSQGYYLARAPFGYSTYKNNDKKNMLAIDPVKSKVIKNIFSSYLDGTPISVIARVARLEGFHLSAKEAVKRVLTNPVYAGLVKVGNFKDNGVRLVKGFHEGIVSETDYWRVQWMISENQNSYVIRDINDELPLRGVLLCEHCNSPHTGARCKGRVLYYWYYWCNKCRGTNFPAKKTEETILSILKRLSLDDDMIEAMKIEAEIQFSQVMHDKSFRLQDIGNKWKELTDKQASLEEKYISNTIDHLVYAKWNQKYTTELFALSKEKSHLEDNNKRYFDLFQKNLPKLRDLRSLYTGCSTLDKQSILRALFPGGLIASKRGTRTNFLLDIFKSKEANLKGLLDVNENGNSAVLSEIPIGVGGANQLEPLLTVIESIIKKVA
jgi:site-specific DNA recombinase